MTLHTALVFQIHDDHGAGKFKPHWSASMQIWDDKTHVCDVDLINSTQFPESGLEADSPLEMHASHAVRQAARMLEEEFFQNMMRKSLHYLKDFQMVTQVTDEHK